MVRIIIIDTSLGVSIVNISAGCTIPLLCVVFASLIIAVCTYGEYVTCTYLRYAIFDTQTHIKIDAAIMMVRGRYAGLELLGIKLEGT